MFEGMRKPSIVDDDLYIASLRLETSAIHLSIRLNMLGLLLPTKVKTIADLCHEQKRLLASSFFSRNAPHRASSEHLFASIAYQMVLAIPAIRGLVLDAIEDDPLIFEHSLESQFTTLIARPLLSVLVTGINQHDPLPTLIIINGTVECTDETRGDIIDVLVHVPNRLELLLIFLLASRSEQDIGFSMELVKADVARIPLDTKYGPDEEIERYLLDKFSEFAPPILYALRYLHAGRRISIKKLVKKFSGQFIYVSTAEISDISSTSTNRVVRCHPRVVPLAPSDLPFAELDAIYRFLINSIENPQLTARILVAETNLVTSRQT